MGATSLTREQLNEAINEFADKIMDALGATVTDEETSEPELTGTKFKAYNMDGDLQEMDANLVNHGTLIVDSVVEYFRVGTLRNTANPWVCYNGEQLTNEGFAERMREQPAPPRIVHNG